MGAETRAGKIEELERAGEFEKLLKKPVRTRPPPPSDFEKLLKLPRAAADELTPAARAVGRVAKRVGGGELAGAAGVILGTVLFPDEKRREQEAKSEAARQKAIARANRKPPPGEPPLGIDMKTLPKRIPRPQKPPKLLKMPDFDPTKVMSSRDRRKLKEPDLRIPRATLPKRLKGGKRFKKFDTLQTFPDLKTVSSTPKSSTWWDPLFNFGKSIGKTVLRDTIRHYAPRPRHRRKGGLLPGFPGFGFDASTDTSPIPRPRAKGLTSVIRGGVSSGDRCECRPQTPRPSDKVPTVKSYKRRMSQNSLDNLRRG